jgi:hypothetical protein
MRGYLREEDVALVHFIFYSQREPVIPGRRGNVVPSLPHHNTQREIRILEYIENHLLPFVCKKKQIAIVEARTKAGG